MKIIIHLTWDCQLHCPYCWCRALGWHGPSVVVYWKVWAKWLLQAPRPMIVDFSGGEPTLYPDLPKLVGVLSQAGIGWAITTNLIAMQVMEESLEHPGCVAVNVSVHPDSPRDIQRRAAYLQMKGVQVQVNRVVHESVPKVDWAGNSLMQIPFQDFSNGRAMDGKHRLCSAGVNHLVCAPFGEVYRCAVHMQSGMPPVADVRTSFAEAVADGAEPCSVGCTTCYTTEPSAWEVEMWP